MGRSTAIDAVPDVEQSSYSDALGSDVTRIRIDAVQSLGHQLEA